jgi:hypothetical protein
MWRNTFWALWKKWSGFVVGAILILVGSLMLLFRPQSLARDFGIALLIAGVLTVTVDPYIKGKAQRETARDIFHHMLGYGLPEQIQNRLREIVETTEWYRTDMDVRYAVSESSDSVLFETEQEFTITNATNHDLDFEPAMEFEKTEYPVLRRVICFQDKGYGREAALRPHTMEPRAVEYRGKPLKIEAGGKRRFKYEYRIQYPIASGVFSLHFKYPTIGLALSVKSPEGLRVTASPAAQECVGEWRYVDRLFMPGDHTEIRWEKV